MNLTFLAFWLFIRTLCGDLFVCRSFAMVLAASAAIRVPCRRRQDLWCVLLVQSLCVSFCAHFFCLSSFASIDCDHHQAKIATHCCPALLKCKESSAQGAQGRPGTLLWESEVDEAVEGNDYSFGH